MKIGELASGVLLYVRKTGHLLTDSFGTILAQ